MEQAQQPKSKQPGSGYSARVVRSFAHGGWWLTDHPFLWNCVDDFGNCVPINNFTLVGWINDSHGLH